MLPTNIDDSFQERSSRRCCFGRGAKQEMVLKPPWGRDRAQSHYPVLQLCYTINPGLGRAHKAGAVPCILTMSLYTVYYILYTTYYVLFAPIELMLCAWLEGLAPDLAVGRLLAGFCSWHGDRNEAFQIGPILYGTILYYTILYYTRLD